MGPIFEKLEFSIFPKTVTDFFYAAVQKIKSDREKSKQRVRLSVHICVYICMSISGFINIIKAILI